MKVKVLQGFTDKHTQKRHAVNEVFECDKERLSEIQSVSKKLVAVVKETPAKETEQETPAKGTKSKEVKE